jgi:hypothetical protein
MATERTPFFNFGASDVALYDRLGVLKAHARVIGDVDCGMSASTAEVEGGTKNFPYAVSVVGQKGTIKLKLREHNPELLAISLGGVLTTYTPAAGAIKDLANWYGTSVVASTGLVSISVKAAMKANLKPGLYFLKMSSTTKANIFAATDEFIKDGTDVTFTDQTGLVNASEITMPSSAGTTVDVDELGLTLTAGAGTIAYTSGDCASFFVVPEFTYGSDIVFGQASPVYDDYIVFISGERNMHDGVNDLVMACFYSCKIYGGSIKFVRKGYAEGDIELMPQYSTAKDAVGYLKTLRT